MTIFFELGGESEKHIQQPAKKKAMLINLSTKSSYNATFKITQALT